MKFIIELIIAWLFHPLAVILTWINIARRNDMSMTKKILWGAVCLVWGIGPTLYVVLGDGAFW